MTLPIKNGKHFPAALRGIFYFMTLTQALKEGNIKLPFDDKMRLARMLGYAAKKKGVAWKKVEETVFVNDYPDEFTNDLQEAIINYLKNKK